MDELLVLLAIEDDTSFILQKVNIFFGDMSVLRVSIRLTSKKVSRLYRLPLRSYLTAISLSVSKRLFMMTKYISQAWVPWVRA